MRLGYVAENTLFPKVLLPTDAQKNALKGILKFTLKQLQHVSV